MPPVQWYVDTSLAVGLRNAAPERLRFFIGADDPQAIFEFKVRTSAAGQRQGRAQSQHRSFEVGVGVCIGFGGGLRVTGRGCGAHVLRASAP